MNSPVPPPISAILAPGETVLWWEQPRPYVFIVRGLPALAYAITWSVLGAFWYHGAMLAPFDGWWRIIPYLSFPFIAAGFSFFFYPIGLGRRARRTWYVVTNQRLFIAQVPKQGAPQLRVFTAEEMAAPQLVKRFDGLSDVILTRRAQDNPHLTPRLDAGFFGLTDGEAAMGAVNETTKP
jgi:hypothetical protein